MVTFLGLEKLFFQLFGVLPKLRGAPQFWQTILFIMGAANCQRTALAFAGKRRLVRRGGEWAAGEAWKWCKYAWNTNTVTQGKTRNTQIQKHTHTHTNTNITIGSLSQIRGGEKWDFFIKNLLTKTALTSVPEYFQTVPGCQNEPIPQG